MASESFYFSHDYNSRNDDKIKQLIRKHGMQGYGVYWAIVEDLYQNGNRMRSDANGIAYDLRTDEAIINSVLYDFELFTHSDQYFSSSSIAKRLEQRDQKSAKARKSAIERWGENDARKKADDCIFYVIRIYSDIESFIKVGITSESVSRRYAGKLAGYQYELLYQLDTTTENAVLLETGIAQNFQPYTPKEKFGGHLECIGIDQCESVLEYIKTHFAMHDVDFRNAKIKFRNAIKERKEKEIITDSKLSVKRFTPPTRDDVDLYAKDEMIGSATSVEKFHDYYMANGWKVGRNAMKDWKAAFRNWVKNEKQYESNATHQQSPDKTTGSRRRADWDALQEWGKDIDQYRDEVLGRLGRTTN